MAIVQEFQYFKPRSLKEAVGLLAGQKKSVVLAGGTDLVSELKNGMVSPTAVIDIKGIEKLSGITFNNKTLKIGALVTFSDILKSRIIREHFPLLFEMAGAVASVAVRNRATVVGNICSAVPCMDTGPVLSVYDAEVNVSGPGCNLRFSISQWFKGNRKTALKGPGIVTSINITPPTKTHAGCFVKLGRYKGEDLAQASVAVLMLANHQYRVGFGSVAAVPVRARKIEAALKGKPLDDKLLSMARDLIPREIAPITDVRASQEYRLHMCQVMLERAMKTAAARLKGEGPAYGTARI
jgi:CO/xanthine dehydrogenase FAD-binding subunit